MKTKCYSEKQNHFASEMNVTPYVLLLCHTEMQSEMQPLSNHRYLGHMSGPQCNFPGVHINKCYLVSYLLHHSYYHEFLIINPVRIITKPDKSVIMVMT